MRRKRIEVLLKEPKGWEGREDVRGVGVTPEVLDSSDAVGCEAVVDVVGEVFADGLGSKGDTWSPLADEVVDMGQAMIAGGCEVFDELCCGDVAFGEGFGANGPDSGYPGEAGSGVPLVGEVEPLAGADGVFDLLAMFEGEERGVADEEGGVGLAKHGDGVGRRGEEGGVGAEEMAEEDLGVNAGAAGCGVGGDDAEGLEGVGLLDDELDRAHAGERGDGAAGNDGERRRQGSDGDEAEVGTSGEKLVGAKRRKSVVELVALGECGGERGVLEVPHEGSRVEEADGSYADGMGGGAQRSSVRDAWRR